MKNILLEKVFIFRVNFLIGGTILINILDRMPHGHDDDDDDDDNEDDDDYDDDDDDDVNDDDVDDDHHHIVDKFGGVLPLIPQRFTFFSSSLKILGLWIVVSNLVCMVLLPWV